MKLISTSPLVTFLSADLLDSSVASRLIESINSMNSKLSRENQNRGQKASLNQSKSDFDKIRSNRKYPIEIHLCLVARLRQRSHDQRLCSRTVEFGAKIGITMEALVRC